MQTSGIKIDINKSDKLLFQESEKIEKIIKFAVGQAVLKQEILESNVTDSKATLAIKTPKKK